MRRAICATTESPWASSSSGSPYSRQKVAALPEVVHRQRGIAVAAEHRQRRRQQHVTADDQAATHHGMNPRMTNPTARPGCTAGRRRGRAVRPEPAVLVEQPGEFAVGVVGGRAGDQHDQRPAVALRPEQQIEEQRHPEQPEEGQHVRHRQDAIGARWPLARCRRRRRGGVAAASGAASRRRRFCRWRWRRRSVLRHGASLTPRCGRAGCRRGLTVQPVIAGPARPSHAPDDRRDGQGEV